MTNTVAEITESNARESERRVIRHDISFLFRITHCAGVPVTNDEDQDKSFYDTLRKAESAMFDKLPQLVEDWRYTDNDDVECDRLQIYEPEFTDVEAEPSSRFYEITIYADREIPLSPTQSTELWPLSVESLVPDVRRCLRSVFAKEGILLEFRSAKFAKKFEQTCRGDYVSADPEHLLP